jgi:hypothetical protein
MLKTEVANAIRDKHGEKFVADLPLGREMEELS